jgi:class 3 adenylate cyclase
MDIGGWLRSLGLEQYEAAFHENAIDTDVLRDLTDQDLKDLGVVLGDRRRILRAIAALDAAPAAAPAGAPDPAPIKTPLTAVMAEPMPAAAWAAAPVKSATEAAGERRYLTVMFCDLVGSTSILAQLDAEEWRDLVGAYLDAASTAVTDLGGHVAKKLGDGLMALFGYPVAHENDAERAVRAALAIQRALADLNRKNAGGRRPELSARIGLETGPAVVDAAGEIYGDVPNVAARAQALAEPGAVLVTAQVQRQVAGLFVAEDRGTHTLKGVPEPTALFRLVRASGGGRHSGARQLTALVGRDEEMAMLMRRWQRARQGEGQLVLIVGEPGLGIRRDSARWLPGLAKRPRSSSACTRTCCPTHADTSSPMTESIRAASWGTRISSTLCATRSCRPTGSRDFGKTNAHQTPPTRTGPSTNAQIGGSLSWVKRTEMLAMSISVHDPSKTSQWDRAWPQAGYSAIGWRGSASYGSSFATTPLALVPGMISKRGSKSTMVEASCFKMLASPCTFAVPSAISASSVFAPVIVSSRSGRLIVRVRSGLLAWNPLMFVSVAFSSSTMNFSPLSA